MTTFLTSSSVLRRSVGALLLVAVIIATTNGQATATTEWGQATPVVFANGVQNANRDTYFNSVSCASAGNCVAVGRFKNLAGDYEAFTMSMVAGVWGQATPAVFANGVQNANPFTFFNSVSCASAGNCVAAGNFKNLAGGYEAFTMTAVNNTPAPTTTETPTTTEAPSTTETPTTTVATSTTVVSSTTVAPSTTETPTTTETPLTEAVVMGLPLATTPLVVSGSLSPGSEVTATAGGFTPGEFVQLIVASTPRVIGSGNADAQGFVTLTGTIPVNLGSGTHTLAVYAPASGTGFKQTITVSGLSLPATGSNYNGVLILALLAVVVGTVVVVRRQRLVA